MILYPNSKINIGLYVLNKRDDGYHNIETIMVPTRWSDVLEIVPSRASSHTLTTSGREVKCPPEKNLIFKAIEVMAKMCEVPPTDFYLHKIVPDGAGLGGGSADAASTVIGLNRLYNLGLSQSQMLEILSKVGADCPFFLYDHPMLATGIGTKLSYINLDLSGLYIVIVKPLSESVSTAQAYGACRLDDTRPSLLDIVLNTNIYAWQNLVFNDFEQSVSSLIPAIKIIKNDLNSIGAAYTAMSGSGSAVYGLFTKPIDHVNVIPIFQNCDVYVGKL